MQRNEEIVCYYRANVGAIRARWVIFSKPVLRAADAGQEIGFQRSTLSACYVQHSREAAAKSGEYKARVAPVFLYRKYIPIICARDFVFADDVYESPFLSFPSGTFLRWKMSRFVEPHGGVLRLKRITLQKMLRRLRKTWPKEDCLLLYMYIRLLLSLNNDDKG